jgi:hypothetical protein
VLMQPVAASASSAARVNRGLLAPCMDPFLRIG